MQAIYLFSSYSAHSEWPANDVDIALLLPPNEARQQPQTLLDDCHFDLVQALDKPVDLLNLRQVPTVFQKEIIAAERRLHCADDYATAEFEMLTLSFYQKLNEERKEILKAFEKTGKAYQV